MVEFPGGGEGYMIVTDSMLMHENYLYTSALDTPAKYPGGEQGLNLYIKKNLRYPEAAIKNGTQGRVMIRFIVEKNGRLTNVAAVRGIGDGCDEEAVRLVKKTARWIPGKIHNIPVRTEFVIPVAFNLPENN